MAGANAARNTGHKRPGDFTGVQGKRLSQQAAKEKADAEQTLAEREAEEKARKANEVIDYTVPTGPRDDVSEGPVEVRPAKKRIRVTDEIQDMTFGREVFDKGEYDDTGACVRPPRLGNLRSFSFEPGTWYEVSTELADHLQSIGYLYE